VRTDAAAPSAVLDRDGVQALFDQLVAEGFDVLGPTVRDGAIVLDIVRDLADLPEGWGDEQSPGRYRLVRREDRALFGYAVGPHSPKNVLFPPRRRLWSWDRDESGGQVVPEPEPPRRVALVGVRACELAGIAVQDRVLLSGSVADSAYAVRRRDLFLVAVNCAEPAGTCFCVSMDTGPAARSGYDLALTELLDGDRQEFAVATGSERGAAVLAALPCRPATEADCDDVDAVVERSAGRMGRVMQTAGLPELLAASLEHPRWDDVASRCLTCGNCTMACPTCFCTTVNDVTDLRGEHAERWQHWDSCFSLEYSHLHGGGPTRSSSRSRYRQWLTHKLGTWHQQFGTSGCIGCGRCLAWCPVGIDITEEVAALRIAPEVPTDPPEGAAP
jgi:ferredoxin